MTEDTSQAYHNTNHRVLYSVCVALRASFRSRRMLHLHFKTANCMCVRACVCVCTHRLVCASMAMTWTSQSRPLRQA